MDDKRTIRKELAIQFGKSSEITHRLLDQIGDKLAEREGYSTHSGIDAVLYYLMQKHHWMPSQVRSMTLNDLHFAVSEEE